MPELKELNDELAALEVQHEHLLRLKSAVVRLEEVQNATTETTEAAGAAIEHSKELAETLEQLTIAINEADFPSLIGRIDEHVREIESQLGQTRNQIEATVDQLKEELETYQEGATERLERFRNKLDAVDNRAVSINQAVQNALSRLETVERHVQDDLDELAELVTNSQMAASEERQKITSKITGHLGKIRHTFKNSKAEADRRHNQLKSDVKAVNERVEFIYKYGAAALGLIILLLFFIITKSVG